MKTVPKRPVSRTFCPKTKLPKMLFLLKVLNKILPRRFLRTTLHTEIFHYLTLIRAAGGIHDFRNFKEIYLSNGLSSNLQNSFIPRKTSREYILLNTLERKTAFSASYRPKRARNRSFFRRFWLFRTAVKVNMTSSPPLQGRALPPPIVGAPSTSGAAHAVSSSF
jgi:hypothetical protein